MPIQGMYYFKTDKDITLTADKLLEIMINLNTIKLNCSLCNTSDNESAIGMSQSVNSIKSIVQVLKESNEYSSS